MARPLFPLRSILPRRRMIHDTIMTAGPGGAQNPLPGSLAAQENEILSRLTGNTILTNANIVAPSRSPLTPGQQNQRGQLGLPQPSVVSHARGAEPADQNMDGREQQSGGIKQNKQKQDESFPKAAQKSSGDRQKMPSLEITVRDSFGTRSVKSDDMKQRHPTRKDLAEGKGLILEKRFPVDNQFMKREGRRIIVDEAVKIAKGEKEGFTQKDGVVFLGGHILSPDVARLASRALKVKTEKDFQELEQKIKGLDEASQKSSGEERPKLNGNQVRGLMSIARSNIIDGPITNSISRDGLLDRLGPPFRMLDARVSKRKVIGGGGGSDTALRARNMKIFGKKTALKGLRATSQGFNPKGGALVDDKDK